MLALAACGCNAVYGLDETRLVNDNPRTLVFDSSDINEDLVDFPVPLFLDPTLIDYTAITDPATDLRFSDPDTGADLPFEVESWESGGDSVVWVRVPQIDRDSSSDHVLMYYGPQARGSADPASVWRDYELVVHGQPGRYQSAAPDLAPQATGITSVAGAIGPAFQLGATGNHSIRYGQSSALFAGWPAFTVEMWLYADYPDSSAIGATEPRIIEQRLPLTGGRLFDEPDVSEFVVMQIDVHFTGTAETSYSPTFVPLRTWVHLMWTFDGRLLWIYRNGALSQIDVIASSPVQPIAPTEALTLGHPTDAIAGMLDEVRISRAYRSDAWIEAQYRAMRRNFVVFPRPGERL